jgi:hypothetical protein
MKYQSKTGITFEVVGIPRSGQHGIATWLMGNIPSPSLFVNNFSSIRPDEIWYKNGKRFLGGVHEKPYVVGIGLEGLASLADDTVHPSVFVIRDIKNHMASLIKHKTLNPNWDNFFKNWKEYALLGLVDVEKPYKYLTIPFSLWHCSRPFREDHFRFFRKLLSLGPLEYNDNTRKDVMASGGGSSFDGQSFIGCGDKMKVNDRWKEFNLPPIPSELLDMNDELFGDIYG